MKQFRDFPYLVSEDGRIWNTKLKMFMKTRIDRGGYEVVSLRKPGVRVHLNVHRIVCEVFHKRPEMSSVVLHLDSNPLNNHKDNLKWGTQSENIQQAYDEGYKKPSYGFAGKNHSEKTKKQISKSMLQ
jgi:hypothetical protein